MDKEEKRTEGLSTVSHGFLSDSVKLGIGIPFLPYFSPGTKVWIDSKTSSSTRTLDPLDLMVRITETSVTTETRTRM